MGDGRHQRKTKRWETQMTMTTRRGEGRSTRDVDDPKRQGEEMDDRKEMRGTTTRRVEG